MKLTEYVPLALRTEKPLPTNDRLMHGCMGIITEIGELVSELKRIAIYGKPLDDDRKKHILLEAGDVMWYIAIVLDALKADIATVQTVPTIQHPEHAEGKYPALSLMLGEHCGRVCNLVEEICMDEIGELGQAMLLASLSMIMFGLYVVCKDCGGTLEQAMADNIAKLQIRYPNAYSNEAAEARADVGGADARVS